MKNTNIGRNHFFFGINHTHSSLNVNGGEEVEGRK